MRVISRQYNRLASNFSVADNLNIPEIPIEIWWLLLKSSLSYPQPFRRLFAITYQAHFFFSRVCDLQTSYFKAKPVWREVWRSHTLEKKKCTWLY